VAPNMRHRGLRWKAELRACYLHRRNGLPGAETGIRNIVVPPCAAGAAAFNMTMVIVEKGKVELHDQRITSSTRNSSDCGIVRRMARAVFRLKITGSGLLERQLSRFCLSENPIGLLDGKPEDSVQIDSVGHEAAEGVKRIFCTSVLEAL
jgi:hypothetical protein